MIYNIRKWRHNKKRTGFIVEISCYDEENDKWYNNLVHVPRADAYAGKNEDELPACLGAVKGDCLVIKCRIFDDYVPKETPKRTQSEPDWDDTDWDDTDWDDTESDPPKKTKIKKFVKRVEDDDDISF